jgi:hypothetical protein
VIRSQRVECRAQSWQKKSLNSNSTFSSFHHRGRFEFRFLVEFLSPRSIGPKSNRTVFAFSIELKAIRNGHQRGAAPVRKMSYWRKTKQKKATERRITNENQENGIDASLM